MGGAGSGHPLRTQEDWERAARELLDEGQTFLSHDICREGLKAYPGSHKLAVFGAIALSQTGAIDEARRLLQPVLDALLVDEEPFRRLEVSLRKSVDLAGRQDSKALQAMVELAQSIDLVRGKTLVSTADAETYTSLARVFREAYAASGHRHDLDLCGELSLRAFRANGDSRDGVDAATTAWLRGDAETARELATQVRDALLSEHEDLKLPPAVRYRRMANLGQAQLLLDDADGAIATFHWAAAIEGAGYPPVVSALNKLKLLEEAGKGVPTELYRLVKPPRVVVCTGHPLDRPGEPPHFPPELEAEVRAEIAQTLEEIDAQIGYSMAACGTDLLFIEAMLERGAEVNVLLPFALDDFIAAQVRYAGPRWEMRFRNALKLASTVTYATEERYLGHAMLYRFANQCLHGLATLRAGFLRTSPTLLAVWDMMPGSLVGGAAEFIDQWEDISALRIIDLDGLLQRHTELAGEAPALPEPEDGDIEVDEGRVIRSMMFCDIAGYSKLKEEHVPIYLDFLDLLHQRLANAGLRPMAVNTWGDAIFAVMPKASPMAEYALTLQEAVNWADEILADRLPHPLSLRISLHAGPVFEAVDPICGRRNFYGSHINRAARLEPVTVIGHVYATQQFVAVLTAEQSALRSQAISRGEPFDERYVSEYVGQLSLAKDFGRQIVYHLRRGVVRTQPPAAIADPPEEEMPFGESDIGALLEEIETAPEVDAPSVEATQFSEADINALLEEIEVASEVDAPAVEETQFSEADINALLEEIEVAPEMDALAVGETQFSEADINALLEEIEVAPEVDALAVGETQFSEADINALLEEIEVAPEVDALAVGEIQFSEADINALLEEVAVAPEVDAPVVEETQFSEADINALLEEVAVAPEADAPAIEATQFSEADINALLEEVEVAPEVDVPAVGETQFSEADINALLEEVEVAPEMDAPAVGETQFSEADINALLEEIEVAPELDAPPIGETKFGEVEPDALLEEEIISPDEEPPISGVDTPDAAVSAGDLEGMLNEALPETNPRPRALRTAPQRSDDIHSVLAAVASLIERADGMSEPATSARARPKPPPPAPPPPPAKPADIDAAARLLDEEVLFPGA